MSWRISSFFHLSWLQETDLSHRKSICFCLSHWMNMCCQPPPSPNLIHNWKCRRIGNCFINIFGCFLRKFGCQKETEQKCSGPREWDEMRGCSLFCHRDNAVNIERVIWSCEFGPMMTIRKNRWGVRQSEDLGLASGTRARKRSEESAIFLEEFESVVSSFLQ